MVWLLSLLIISEFVTRIALQNLSLQMANILSSRDIQLCLHSHPSVIGLISSFFTIILKVRRSDNERYHAKVSLYKKGAGLKHSGKCQAEWIFLYILNWRITVYEYRLENLPKLFLFYEYVVAWRPGKVYRECSGGRPVNKLDLKKGMRECKKVI